MKKAFYLTLSVLSTLFITKNLFAQHFLNGDLEPNASSTVTACLDNSVGNVNTIPATYLVTMPGSLLHTYVGSSTCVTGPAEKGNYYMGVEYSPANNLSSHILLELDNVMTPGQPYYYSFYYKGPVPTVGNGAELEYGYGPDSTGAADSVYGIVSAPPAYDIWTLKTIMITVPYPTRYIWIGAKKPLTGTDTAITYVDNFFDTTSSISHVEKLNLQLYPNPFTTVTQLTLSSSVSLPCRLVVYDITGRVVMENDNLKQRTIQINRPAANSSIYFLKLTDHNNNIYTTKLLTEQ